MILSLRRVAAAVAAAAALVLAGCGRSGEDAGQPRPSGARVEVPADYPLSTCFVSGLGLQERGGPVKHEAEGRTIYFCCKRCLKAFKKDPAKHLKDYDAAVAKAKSSET